MQNQPQSLATTIPGPLLAQLQESRPVVIKMSEHPPSEPTEPADVSEEESSSSDEENEGDTQAPGSTANSSASNVDGEANADATANTDATTKETPSSPKVKRSSSWRLPDETRLEIVRMLIIGWKPIEIAQRQKISVNAVYTVKNNLMKYGTSIKPKEKDIGRKPKMTKEDEDKMFEWLVREGWKEQLDMKDWLLRVRGIVVQRSTISRILKKRGWTETSVKRLGGKAMEKKEDRRRRGPGKKTLIRAGVLGPDGKSAPQSQDQLQPQEQEQMQQQQQQQQDAAQTQMLGVDMQHHGPPIDPQLGMHQAQHLGDPMSRNDYQYPLM